MRAVVSFFAREHLLGNLLTVFIIIGGAYSLWNIRRDIWPDVNFNVTSVSAVLPGASPEQVEKLVVNPIETAIREVDGIKEVYSTSTESQAIIVINLDRDARDTRKTNADIKNVIDRVDDLPEEAEEPLVTEIDASRYPVLEVTVGGDADPMVLRDTSKRVADELSLLPLVAGVDKLGYRKREYQVVADLDKLAARQVALGDLIQSISTRNVSVPGGTAEVVGGAEMLVRTEAQYNSVKDIENSVVQASDSGFATKIKDVATVTEGLARPERLYRAYGESSINLSVKKKSNADAFALVEQTKEFVESIKDSMPKGVELGYSNDFSIYLTNRIDTLKSNLFIGLILVTIILALFLPWQVTLVVSVGIPVAFFAAITVAYALGISINIISLLGLIIVLGMLVDDAIVVSENIWRHVQKGDNVLKSVTDGASEVFGAVVASILTTVSAFAPMLFMTGIMGAFVFEIPVMVILALAFSLFEVFVVMPSHFTSWVGPFIGSGRGSDLKERPEKAQWFTALTKKYQRYVKWSLNYRYAVVGALCVFVVFTAFIIFKLKKFDLFPPEGIDMVFIEAEAPVGTSLEKTQELIQPIEEAVAKIPAEELVDFTAAIGIIQQDANDPFTRRGSNFANVRIRLSPINKRDRSADEILDQLRKELTSPGKNLGQLEGFTKINYERARQGPPQGRPIQFGVVGSEFTVLREITNRLKQKMAEIDGVIDPQDSFIPGKTEWQVYPIPLATAEAGLTAQEISTSVRAAFEGIVASSIRKLDEEIDIRVKVHQGTERPDEKLNRLRVGNRQGALVALKEVARFEDKESISAIQHHDYKRVINVSSDVDLAITTPLEATDKLKPMVEEILNEYPGYAVSWGGQDKDTAESMTSLFRAFGFAALFIFGLLLVTFRNLLQPILILSSIPLGFAGVSYAMIIHNRPFSFMAMLGMIALAGVIVNNSIVFIDFVNRQRKKGSDVSSSIIETAGVRLRPIVLTTVTTVIGLLPTAYGATVSKITGFGGADPFIVPIAIALSWGLAIGTLLVVIFMPALIRTTDDFSALFDHSNEAKNLPKDVRDMI